MACRATRQGSSYCLQMVCEHYSAKPRHSSQDCRASQCADSRIGKNARITMDKYTFIDLFAGCGGLSEGFMSSGHFTSLAHVEWEMPMVDSLRHRLVKKWGYTELEAMKDVIHFDIQKTEELLNGDWSEETLQLYGSSNASITCKRGLRGKIGDSSVDLIIGGPPCQAYSIHGRAQDKNGMNDDYRNYLFESFVKIVNAFKPKLFVFENVPGMLSAHPGGIKVTKRIYEAFTSIGYVIRKPEELDKCIFNAVDYQVPQERKRVILIGIPQNSKLNLDEIYSSIDGCSTKGVIKTVRDALGNFPPLYPLPHPQKYGRKNISHTANSDPNYTQHEARYLSIRDIGVYRRWVNEKLNHISHQEKIDFYFNVTGHKTLYAKYKSLEWDKPSQTVVAHLCKDGHMFIHPDASQARSITIREAATLMTFPLDFDFIGTNAMCYRMIGNAVPVLFAQGIANGIAKVLS